MARLLRTCLANGICVMRLLHNISYHNGDKHLDDLDCDLPDAGSLNPFTTAKNIPHKIIVSCPQ